MREDSFEARFDLEIGLEEAQRRFTVRIQNEYISPLNEANNRAVANALGVRYEFGDSLDGAVILQGGWTFEKALRAAEAVMSVHPDQASQIQQFLSEAEVDLGVRLEDGRFYPAGAESLDEGLVNDPLAWLRDSNLESVLNPYQKALNDLVRLANEPERAADVVTDAYESLEALSKIVTGRLKDLSGNRQKFVSQLDLAFEYGDMLKAYVSFGCTYRHAAMDPAKPKKPPSYAEAESFVYLTGTFLRLALQRQDRWA